MGETWAFHDVLRDDVDAWVARMREAAQAAGQHVPGAVFRDRLAARLGVTPRQLDRYCAGETMPDGAKVAVLCDTIGSRRCVEHLARACGLLVVDLTPGESARWIDQVGQMAHVAREAGQIALGAASRDWEQDRRIRLETWRAVRRELHLAREVFREVSGSLHDRLAAALHGGMARRGSAEASGEAAGSGQRTLTRS